MSTVNSMINGFISSIQKQNGSIKLGNLGTNPKFPLIIVYLGNETDCIHKDLSNELFQVWSSYKESIEFLHVKYDDGNYIYKRIKSFEQLTYKDVDGEDVQNVFTEILGEDRFFEDKNQIYVHYILNSNEINDKEQLNKWFGFIKTFKNNTNKNCLSLLTLLLDKSNKQKEQLSNLIQNEISVYLENNNITEICDSVYMLSNERQDGTIFKSWNKVVPSIADIIMLTVSNLDSVKSSIYQSKSKVFYTSFNRVEKPSYQIAQVVVSELINYVNKLINEQKTNISFDSIRDKLLIKNGIFQYSEVYIDTNIKPLLPTKEQLNFFPRKNLNKCDLSKMTEDGFNDETMNTWSTFFQSLKEKLPNNDEEILEKWKEQYLKYLEDNFDINEKECIFQSVDKVFELLNCEKDNDMYNPNILDNTVYRLKLDLSKDEKVKNQVIKSSIDGLKKNVDKFYSDWSKFVKNLNEKQRIYDKTIVNYYSNITKNFLNLNVNVIAEDLKKCSSMQDIEAVLGCFLDKLANSHKAFRDPFVEEIKQRLAYGEIKDAINYIKGQMIGGKVYTYFSPNLSINAPEQTVVFMQTGTDLYNSLKNTLNNKTVYYDTGVNYKADVIRIHVLDKDNLMKSGD